MKVWRLLALTTCSVLAAMAIGSAIRFSLNFYDLTGNVNRISRVSIRPTGVTHELIGAVGASRSWKSGRDANVELRFDARIVGQEQAAEWELLPSSTGAGTLALESGWLKISGESLGNARTLLVLNTQLDQEEYRVRFRVEPASPGGFIAGMVALSNQDGRSKSSLSFRASSDALIEASWMPSEPLATSVLVVMLSDLKGDGAIGPPYVTRANEVLEPSQQIAVRAGNQEHNIQLGNTWSAYKAPGLSSAGDNFTAQFTIGSGVRVQIRNIAAIAESTGRALTIQSPRSRTSLLGLHPNLLAHSVVSILALLLLLGGPPWMQVSGIALAYCALLAFGSRTALLAASLAILIAVITRFRLSRLVTVSTIASLSALSALFALSDTFQRNPDSGASGRLEIWTVALDGFLRNPLGGISMTFGELWALQAPSSPPVSHAHNLWLELAVHHGVLGLACAVLVTILVGVLLWRKYQWIGVSTFLALAIMNTFDYTLRFPGVYVPVIIAVLLPVSWTPYRSKPYPHS